MLKELHRILVELELTGAAEADFDMNVHYGHHMSCYLRSTTGESYFLKVVRLEERETLENEHAALTKVHARAPRNVARPLALVQSGDRHVLLLEDKSASTLRDLSAVMYPEAALDAWVEFFDALYSCGAAREERGLSLPEPRRFFERELPALSDYIRHEGLLDESQSEWISQHGDMSAFNLGLNGTTPVVYDWEDYGKLGLSGLDLAVLIGSLLDYKLGPLRELLNERHADYPAFQRLVEACRLNVSDFRKRIPLYFGCFLWLKRSHGYTQEIQQRIHTLIDELLREPLTA